MEQPNYEIDTSSSGEDDGYIANVPELTYRSAWGKAYEDTLREARVATDLHPDTLRQDGRPVPKPEVRQHSWIEVAQESPRASLYLAR